MMKTSFDRVVDPQFSGEIRLCSDAYNEALAIADRQNAVVAIFRHCAIGKVPSDYGFDEQTLADHMRYLGSIAEPTAMQEASLLQHHLAYAQMRTAKHAIGLPLSTTLFLKTEAAAPA